MSNGKMTFEEYRLLLRATLADHETRIHDNEKATTALDKRLAVLAIKVTALGAGAGLGGGLIPLVMKALGGD